MIGGLQPAQREEALCRRRIEAGGPREDLGLLGRRGVDAREPAEEVRIEPGDLEQRVDALGAEQLAWAGERIDPLERDLARGLVGAGDAHRDLGLCRFGARRAGPGLAGGRGRRRRTGRRCAGRGTTSGGRPGRLLRLRARRRVLLLGFVLFLLGLFHPPRHAASVLRADPHQRARRQR